MHVQLNFVALQVKSDFISTKLRDENWILGIPGLCFNSRHQDYYLMTAIFQEGQLISLPKVRRKNDFSLISLVEISPF